MIKFYTKVVIYMIMFAMSFYALSAFDFNRFLKKEARANGMLLYIILSLIMGYLLGELLISITYFFNI